MPDSEADEFSLKTPKPMAHDRFMALVDGCRTGEASPLLDMLQDAVQNIVWWQNLYNRLRDDQARDFEKWFRLAGSTVALTGYQPECSTVIDELMIGYSARLQLIRELIPDDEKREAALREVVEKEKDRLRKEREHGE